MTTIRLLCDHDLVALCLQIYCSTFISFYLCPKQLHSSLYRFSLSANQDSSGHYHNKANDIVEKSKWRLGNRGRCASRGVCDRGANMKSQNRVQNRRKSLSCVCIATSLEISQHHHGCMCFERQCNSIPWDSLRAWRLDHWLICRIYISGS